MTHNKQKLLLVEDDENLGFVIKDNLEQANYEVTWVKDGLQGLEYYRKSNVDLCLLDVMLPKMDGFSLLKEIRQTEQHTPIIMLTARNLQEDKLIGFQYGADDYVVKPLDMQELILRINVFLRRTKKQDIKLETVQIGHFTFDISNYQLTSSQSSETLTEREAILLKMFFDHKNTVLKREVILEEIWGENDYFLGRSLDVFVSRLRKYLQSDDRIQIVNQHGVGFKLKM